MRPKVCYIIVLGELRKKTMAYSPMNKAVGEVLQLKSSTKMQLQKVNLSPLIPIASWRPG